MRQGYGALSADDQYEQNMDVSDGLGKCGTDRHQPMLRLRLHGRRSLVELVAKGFFQYHSRVVGKSE
jgi:hypothetical protein